MNEISRILKIYTILCGGTYTKRARIRTHMQVSFGRVEQLNKHTAKKKKTNWHHIHTFKLFTDLCTSIDNQHHNYCYSHTPPNWVIHTKEINITCTHLRTYSVHICNMAQHNSSQLSGQHISHVYTWKQNTPPAEREIIGSTQLFHNNKVSRKKDTGWTTSKGKRLEIS